MKKSNRNSKALESPKPAGAMTPINERRHLRPVSSANLSRERLMAGASTTTEVLKEILQHQSQQEPTGHWGINE